MRKLRDVWDWLMRVIQWLKKAARTIKGWYVAARRFVTKRSVYFPALGVVVFATILLALVTGHKLFQIIAVFSVTGLALLINGEFRRHRAHKGIVIDDGSGKPKHASKRVSRFLHPNESVETFKWEKREHPMSLIDIRPGIDWFTQGLESWAYWRFWMPGLAIVVVFGFGLLITRNAIAAFVLLVLTLLGARLFEWHRRYLVLTTRRYIAIRGIVSVRELQVRLEKMQDFRVEVPWHSTLLWYLGLIGTRYGTLIIAVAGDASEELKSTPWFPYIDYIRAVITDLTLNPHQAPSEEEAKSDL